MNNCRLSYTLLLLVCAALIGCTATDDLNRQKSQKVRVSAEALLIDFSADIDSITSTRALYVGGDDGKKFVNLWRNTDRCIVYKLGENEPLGILAPMDERVRLTSLTEQLELFSPTKDMNFKGQKGSIGSVSSGYSYSSDVVTVQSFDGANLTTTQATFKNKVQFIGFRFYDENGKLLHPKKLTLKSTTGKLVEAKDADGLSTYTYELEINCEKEIIQSGNEIQHDYPSVVYVSLLNESNGKDTYTLEVLNHDDKVYRAVDTWNSTFGADKLTLVTRTLPCVSVDLGLQTGITPPENNDVGGENVTPAEE